MNRNRFAVIGHPIAHTMSPFIHARLFALSGRTGRYEARDIPPDALAGSMPALRLLDGFNITIPHKQAIIPFLDGLDEKAEIFHSVNTVKNENGRLTGYSTDGAGFRRALRTAGVGLGGHTVILGAGGAARALAFEAAPEGGRVTVAARPHSLDAARRLCADLAEKIPGAKADFCRMEEIAGPVDLLANATPVGMYPNAGACPVAEEVVRNAACVFDAVYNPAETALLKLARKNGARAAGGMSMLVWQAAEAHRIWYGAEFGERDVEQLCADAAFEMRRAFGNIVLCGFMGSGKTTVGRLLAERTGRDFVDLDQWIERQEGMTVAELFERRGEAEFRRLEREAVKELGAKSGLVLAAGGGTLINPENAAALKESGVVVFLDAALDAVRARLDGDRTRPLLAGPGRAEEMERLYRERSGIYRAAADRTVSANGTPEQVADAVEAALSPQTM